MHPGDETTAGVALEKTNIRLGVHWFDERLLVTVTRIDGVSKADTLIGLGAWLVAVGEDLLAADGPKGQGNTPDTNSV